MRPVTVHTSISASREEIFDYVGDLANHVAFADHFCLDYRLARPKSDGLGASARFKVNPPGPPVWVETHVVEYERPSKIVSRNRMARVGRSTSHSVWEFIKEPDETRVELTVWTEPGHRWDEFMEKLGARRWVERKNKVMLRRLRQLFEDPPEGPLPRAAVAGYEPLKNPRFGDHPPLAALRESDSGEAG